MGFSPFLDECRAEGLWPIGPSCNKIISFGVYTFFIVVNFIVLCIPNSNSANNNYRRMTDDDASSTSKLTISKILSICTIFAVICQSIFYFCFTFYFHPYTHLLLAFCVSKLFFWILSLCSFSKWRNQPSTPISLAFAFSAALLIHCIPLTDWKKYFEPTSKNRGDLTFYIIELALVTVVFFFTIVTGLFNFSGCSSRESAWNNLSKKVVTVAPYIWPTKSISLQLRVVFCLFLLIIGRLINVSLPILSKWIVDELATPDTFQYSLLFLATFLKFLQGNGAMGGFLNTVRTYLWIPIQQYTTRELEVELFKHLHSLSLRWHLSRKTGQVLRVMDRGTSSVNNILNYILFNVVPTIADIVIAVIFFFSAFNAYFGLIVFGTMALYLTVTISITEWRTQYIREANEKDNATSAIATDSLINYETVKYYGNEEFEVNRFKNAIESYQVTEWKTQASLAFLNCLQNAIIGIGMIGGSVFVVYMIVHEKTLTVGDYVLFTTYLLQLYTPLNFFGTIYRVIQKAFVDMENMFDLMNDEVEVKDLPHALPYTDPRGTISVKNLTFEYNTGLPVIKNISFEIGNGQTVALVGSSGSGKSTLIRLLFRLFESTEGSIEFDGIDVRNYTMHSLRQQIGIVPQDTVLFNDTIMYNIRFGRPDASDEEVIEAAKAAMIHEKITSLPEGYATMVGERGLKLSGGEKQRVAIARTILKKPQFIFLDEATSALDTPTERAIQKCLEKLCKSRTGVVVAHRLSTVVNADLILVLDKGIILERGNHKELLAQQGTYASMWEAQIAEQRAKSIELGEELP
ncbi:Heavy metal tolerance factor 1 [Caenorhabditis elegans]|uniref:Heavy metal tolerance factor 1 n=1 Tax=Caenorhabditis elegans TaxID=6239 RepID=HMT1_CAEEL|nr:Heavy metal tolerance factor 1 [Caenorhabditis elegans]G5EFD4.1 RecName: Full=Heavy metal tolerance factor 1 [Caenorhabditis elegans]AAM33380.1 heavy metal tolerance factor 1 [Caenorhabditis elegans]AAM33381.1 heavy metal tolerance factor 1 [Caenorhabditis elegans]CAB04947.3 Heavy metal tolerance factor 1 [Caenorhabditis elegans]|eukprot:NP_001022812.1 see hmt [Caenorhabditis elegans]